MRTPYENGAAYGGGHGKKAHKKPKASAAGFSFGAGPSSSAASSSSASSNPLENDMRGRALHSGSRVVISGLQSAAKFNYSMGKVAAAGR